MRSIIMALGYLVIVYLSPACSDPTTKSELVDASVSQYTPESFDSGPEFFEVIAGNDQEADSELEVELESQAGSNLQLDSETDADVGQLDNLTMCQKWNTIWSSSSAISWNGSAQSCDAGTVNHETLDTVLALTNFYRELATLPLVVLESAQAEALQHCALMMEANDRLSHQPPESWSCYHSDGAYMASQSNLAGSNAIDAVAMYMIDPGNETTMGHRRWIMSQGLESIGVGSTSTYSCMSVLHLNRPRGWVAFPPPGEFPLQATQDRWGRSIDQTGWTIQYDGLSLANAQVTVKSYVNDNPNDPGEELPIELVDLMPNFGSSAAYNIIPQGWRSEVGKRYEVKLVSGNEMITYSVEFVDCDQ